MNRETVKRLIPTPIRAFRIWIKEQLNRKYLIIAAKFPKYNYYRAHDLICIRQEMARAEIVDQQTISFREAKKRYNKIYKSKNVLPHIDFVIGTICTLRCRECTQWNPYLRTKEWYPADEVINDLDTMMKWIDYISVFSLIGGETFAYPELEKPLQYCVNNPKLGYVILSTNGTIYPNDKVLELLKNKKVFTIVDDYKAKNVEEYNRLVNFLKKNHCNHKLYSDQHFTDIGRPRKLQNVSESEKIHRFWTCWLCNACEAIKGNFYRCSRTHGGLDIGVFREGEIRDDYFNFRDIQSKKEMRRKIYEMYSKPYLNTCAACNSKKDRKVYEAAIQLEP